MKRNDKSIENEASLMLWPNNSCLDPYLAPSGGDSILFLSGGFQEQVGLVIVRVNSSESRLSITVWFGSIGLHRPMNF